MKTGKSPALTTFSLCMIDLDAEIVIDLIDFERIKTVLSAIKSNFYGYMPLFGAGGSRFGDAVILLEEAIKNINNSINTKSSNRYVDNKTKTDI